MADYTITLTDTQVKCLESVMVDLDEWITNAATSRADVAQADIISRLVAHCNKNEITIATGIDAQITQAYDLGVVSKASSEEPSPE